MNSCVFSFPISSRTINQISIFFMQAFQSSLLIDSIKQQEQNNLDVTGHSIKVIASCYELNDDLEPFVGDIIGKRHLLCEQLLQIIEENSSNSNIKKIKIKLEMGRSYFANSNRAF